MVTLSARAPSKQSSANCPESCDKKLINLIKATKLMLQSQRPETTTVKIKGRASGILDVALVHLVIVLNLRS